MTLAVGWIMATETNAAKQEPAPKLEDIVGRWSPVWGWCARRECKQTYDIVACAQGWCGVEVGEKGECGRTTLRLSAADERAGAWAKFAGKLSLAADTKPYAIAADIRPADGKMVLRIMGHTGGDVFMPMRSYPLDMSLARAGEPVCKAEDKTASKQ